MLWKNLWKLLTHQNTLYIFSSKNFCIFIIAHCFLFTSTRNSSETRIPLTSFKVKKRPIIYHYKASALHPQPLAIFYTISFQHVHFQIYQETCTLVIPALRPVALDTILVSSVRQSSNTSSYTMPPWEPSLLPLLYYHERRRAYMKCNRFRPSQFLPGTNDKLTKEA